MTSKMSFSGGVSLIFGNNAFQMKDSDYEAFTENPIGTPLYFYGGFKITDDLAVGLGVTTPYGNSLKWEDGWAGRYLIDEISLKSINIQPTLSYKITDWLSLGAGAIIATNSVSLTKSLPASGAEGDGSINLEGNTMTYGFNAGVMMKMGEQFSAGISYRSKMEAQVEGGTVEIDRPEALSAYFPSETKFDGMLPLPANFNIGVAWTPIEKFMIAVDVNFVQWEAYDSLIFDFADADETPLFQDSHNPRLYSNTMIYRIGASYQLKDEITVRLGAYYDETPIDDDYLSPETPGTNKTGIAGGLTIKPMENLDIDVSMLYIHGQKREANYLPDNFSGTYYTNAFIPGIGISYSF